MAVANTNVLLEVSHIYYLVSVAVLRMFIQMWEQKCINV